MDATRIEALASQKRYRPKDEDELPRLGGTRRITLGPDKTYDTKDFMGKLRGRRSHHTPPRMRPAVHLQSMGVPAVIRAM